MTHIRGSRTALAQGLIKRFLSQMWAIRSDWLTAECRIKSVIIVLLEVMSHGPEYLPGNESMGSFG